MKERGSLVASPLSCVRPQGTLALVKREVHYGKDPSSLEDSWIVLV